MVLSTHRTKVGYPISAIIKEIFCFFLAVLGLKWLKPEQLCIPYNFITPQSTLIQSCREFIVYTSGPRKPVICFHHYTLDLELHTNGKNIVPLLLLWLLLFSTVFLPIHSCYCADLRFVHFIFQQYTDEYLHHTLLIHLPADRDLSGFYHLAILNKASMDT